MTARKRFLEIFNVIGRRGLFWFTVSSTAGILLAIVELGVSVAIALTVKILGITSQDISLPFELGNWQPNTITLISILIGLAATRATVQFLIQQGSNFAYEIIGLRLRLVLVSAHLRPGKTNGSLTSFNTYSNEIFQRAAEFFRSLSASVPIAVQSITMFAVLLKKDIKLTSFGFCGILFVAIVIQVTSKRMTKLSLKLPELWTNWNRILVRTLRNLFLIRSLRLEQYEQQKLKGNLFARSALMVRIGLAGSLTSALPSLFGTVLIACMILIHKSHPQLSGLEFLGFLYIFLRFVQSLSALSNYYGALAQSFPHFLNSTEYFSSFTQDEIRESLKDINKLGFTGSNFLKIEGEISKAPAKTTVVPWGSAKLPEIRLKGVSYEYINGTPVVSQINFSVAPGDALAVIGQSGTGKSTLLSIILGVIEPTSGEVTINQLAPNDYFSANPFSVGYVGPEPFLMEGTVLENISFGNPHQLSEMDIREALRAAHLLDWCDQPTVGLNYNISENGEGLSTGQKQRLSLARALLLKPRLLVLDEISANLDTQTEQEIAQTIQQLKGKTTIIIVSHREGLVKHIENRYSLDRRLN